MINSDFKVIAKSKNIVLLTKKEIKDQILKSFKHYLNNELLDFDVTYSLDELVASFNFRRK